MEERNDNMNSNLDQLTADIHHSAEEILQHLVDNGKIDDITAACDRIVMEKNKKYLDMHPYDIWLGKDGQYHTYLPGENGKERLYRHRKTREELEGVIINYWKAKVENPTFKEVWEEMEQRKLDLGKITASSYSRHKRTYKTHCQEFGKRKIKKITPDEIEEFLEKQIAEHDLTSKAFSSLKTLVKNTFKRAKKRGLISFSVEQAFADMDCFDNAFRKVIKEDFEEVFSEEETELLIPYLIEHPDMRNLGLLLSLVTGIRVGELAALRHTDIDGFVIKIRRTETMYDDENGKSVYDIREYAKTAAGIRDVVIPHDYEWLVPELQKLSPNSEFIFTEKDGTKRLITERFRKRMETVCKHIDTYHKSPHKLRKTYSSILLDSKLVDNKMVTTQLGQRDIRTTESFYHRNRRTLDARQQIISSIPDLQMPDGKKLNV